MTILVELYLKMMLEDGVFHADPHAGNLLVDPAGRIVLLDFGMVLEVERETRRRLVQTVLAAARQDVDGVINGFYELGILDPDVDRGTVRDAAQSLMAIGLRDDVSPRQIQRLVEQVLHTFYEWPLMLPSNLVYFGRAAVLVEGIGLRYDPEFNGSRSPARCWPRSAARLVQGVLQEDPRARITDWTQEALSALRTVRELVRRVERDELRVRWHPRDTLELQRFLAQQVRRALLAFFAFTVALMTSVLYLATRRLAILVPGLADRLRHVPGDLPAAGASVPEPAAVPAPLAGALTRGPAIDADPQARHHAQDLRPRPARGGPRPPASMVGHRRAAARHRLRHRERRHARARALHGDHRRLPDLGAGRLRVQIGGPTGAFVVIVYGIVQRYGVDGLLVATFMARCAS